jgi:hypothetical protein
VDALSKLLPAEVNIVILCISGFEKAKVKERQNSMAQSLFASVMFKNADM